MPFNFRLGKRSQQYNVASKDLFVIPIELLTNECIECTLLSTSTGQECLNNVCQKIGIQQPEYFSLLFRSKKMVDQWIDLNKPLKKQLSKYSTESRLYFRLQYFVPNFHFLSDEVSRYHYFCAMKNLVIDGRIACSRDDAILLASFSLQAEFGDYSPERHTVEYLNNFSLFPKSMVISKIARDVLIECAINAYRNLQGVPPSVAEIYYISEAQRREGYGQEGFPARDLSTGQDVCLGVCIRGIFVVNTDNNTLELFKWMDIANLMHQKKVFTIERFSDKYSKNYSTYDSDYASCIWQTCVEQHQYFMKGIQTASENPESTTNQASGATSGLDQQQQSSSLANNHSIGSLFIHSSDLFNTANSDKITDTTDFNRISQSVYETIGNSKESTLTSHHNVQQLTTISNTDLEAVQEYIPLNGAGNFESMLRKRSSTEPLDLHHITLNCGSANQYNLKSGEVSSNETTTNNLMNQIIHSDMTSNSSSSNHNIPIYENQSNLNDLTYEQRKKLLPPYRNPPDYETFLKHKYLVANSLSQSLSSIPSRLATTTSHNQMNSSSSYSSLVHHLNMHPNIYAVSSSTMSVPQLLQQQKQHSVFSGSVYQNYTDLSNLHVIDRSSVINPPSVINHRCSLPPTTDSFRVNTFESFSVFNRLPYQHQRLQKSGMFTSSSPDLNSLTMIYKRNMQHIKSNGVAKINETNGNMNLVKNHQIKKPHFTSVPDLSFKNSNSNHPIICDLGIEKKYKSKNFFSFGGKNFKFFWPQNKTGSEPNLFNNFSYNPNCYNLKGSKFSVERLDFANQIRNNSNSSSYIGDIHTTRPSKSYTISQKIDELPETSAEQQQQFTSTKDENNFMNNDNIQSGASEQINNQNQQPQMIYISHNQTNREKDNSQEQLNEKNNRDRLDAQMAPNIDSSSTPLTSILTNQPIKTSSRIKVFGKSFDDQDFTKEFELLPRMNPLAKFTTASLPENVLKNRFRDILPYEENRVKLTATKDNKHGYINASHVIMTFGSMKQHYIAAQGPLPNTTLDFWQMVFEQHINLIVMVTNFTESGSQKCYTYLPLSNDPNKNTLRFGDYEITCNYTSTTLTYISSFLTLSRNGQKRNITHLRYTDWNDHSIPGDLQSFLTFLSEMDAIYRQNNREGSGFSKKRYSKQQQIIPPILVHCSAGAGRSGVVILCDALLKCLDYNHFEPIDIPKALIELRFQRMISVQHCEQFRFVCQVLSQNLSNSRLI